MLIIFAEFLYYILNVISTYFFNIFLFESHLFCRALEEGHEIDWLLQYFFSFQAKAKA